MAHDHAMAAAADAHALAARAPADAPLIGLRPHPALPWLLLPDGVPAQVLADAALVKVPNTQDWFRGVVSQRGNLLPVFDLGEWAGHSRAVGEGRAAPTVVAIGIGAEAFALLSHRQPGLLRVGQAAAADHAPVHGRLADYLGPARPIAAGASAGEHAHAFDARRWLGDIAHHITRAG